MIGSIRFIRPGLMISVIGHLGALALGLLLAGASPFDSLPPESIMIDIVTPQEVPGGEGAFGEAPSSGPEQPSNSPDAIPAPQPPSPTAAPSAPQQPQQRAKPQQRNARQAVEQPKPSQRETPQRETSAAQPAPTVPPPELQVQPQPQAQPHPEERPEQPATSDMFAMPLTLPDGRLGGAFDAPAMSVAKLTQDIRAAFLERFRSCAALPAGVDPAENFTFILRISFNRDGTLAAPPLPIGGSPKGPLLKGTAIGALQKCQPYTMFPREAYSEWKVLDITLTPKDFSAR
jgi:hypothetical protein